MQNRLRLVTTEKKAMEDEAEKIVTTIRMMEISLDDNRSSRDYQSDHPDLKVTYPLSRCLQTLREKHKQISKLHRERFEEIKSTYGLRQAPPRAGYLTDTVVSRNCSSPGIVLVTSRTLLRQDCAASHQAKPVYPAGFRSFSFVRR